MIVDSPFEANGTLQTASVGEASRSLAAWAVELSCKLKSRLSLFGRSIEGATASAIWVAWQLLTDVAHVWHVGTVGSPVATDALESTYLY